MFVLAKSTSSGLVQGQLEEDSITSLPITGSHSSERGGGSEPEKSPADDRAWNQANSSQAKQLNNSDDSSMVQGHFNVVEQLESGKVLRSVELDPA